MTAQLGPEVRVLLTPELLGQGCAHIVGLAGVRTALGSRWDRMRESVCAHAEGILRQKLGAADFFLQLDDVSFLVVAPTASREEGQVLCLKVAHDLSERLFGRCHADTLHIGWGDTLEHGALAAKPLDRAALAQLAAKADLTIFGLGADRRDRADHGGQQPARPPNRTLIYSPLWDISREVIAIFCCSAPATETAVPRPSLRSEVGGLLARVKLATDSLSAALCAGRKYVLALPMPYDLLGSPVARMEVAALCRSLPAALRPYLQFEIVDLPDGVPQSRLAELVSSLRPFCRTVAACFPPNVTYSNCQASGLGAIGFSCRMLADSAEAQRALLKLSQAARRLQMQSFVLDVESPSMLRAAFRHNIQLIGGSFLPSSSEQALSVQRFTFADIATPQAARRGERPAPFPPEAGGAC